MTIEELEALGVTINPLKWVSRYRYNVLQPNKWEVEGDWSIYYRIEQYYSGSAFTFRGKDYDTLEDAKAAAQRDYESRILACLTAKTR